MFLPKGDLCRPAATATMTIGRLAELTRCNIPTIRYYEEIGLLPPARRRISGHRVYDAASVPRLTFIRQCRDLDFPIDYIRSLISLSGDDDRDCGAVREIAQMRLDVVRTKIAELQALEASLTQVVGACTTTCCDGPAPDCSIFKDIAMVPDQPVQRGCCG